MRYPITFAVLLLSAFMVCTAGAAYAASPPSTDGWFLTPVVDGDNINLFLGVDNMDDLANWQGLVSRTWGDPTGADSSQFLSLGNGVVLQSMTLKVDADPQVSVEFHVVNNGSSASLITITSSLVSFATLPSCEGTATAAVTVTDRTGKGALATGGYQNGAFYHATSNNWADTFAYLINNPITAAPYSSNTAIDNVPPWQAMGPTSDISAEFKFYLSAGDSASGTSNFVVLPVPEPGAMLSLFTGIVGLVGYTLRRRRA